MNWKLLDKDVTAHEEELGITPTEKKLQELKGLPFCNWDDPNDIRTFNHAIGLPEKYGIVHPFYDYEKLVINTIERDKRMYILKSTGLGITELLIRHMAWLALSSDKYQGSQFCLVTGPNINLAIGLIKRMKDLFLPRLGITFDSDQVSLNLNQVSIRAYPSHHLDSMRSLTSPKYILLDEGDFLPPQEQLSVRDVAERYIGKSDPFIAFVSTPSHPGGLFQKILQEPKDMCIYTRLILPYTVGENKIYTINNIQEAKRSVSFDREYRCRFMGSGGSIFRDDAIAKAISRGDELSSIDKKGNMRPMEFIETTRSVGIDPGFGSSPFAVVISEIRTSMVNIVYADEFERPSFNKIISIVMKLIKHFNITFRNGGRIYVDVSNPPVISTLKEALNEDPDYTKQISYYKHMFKTNYDLEVLQDNMFVIPVPFSNMHRTMLSHCKELLEYQGGILAINSKFDKLITALQTAVEKSEGSLDKEATSYDDILDAFRLSMIKWKLKKVPQNIPRRAFSNIQTRSW